MLHGCLERTSTSRCRPPRSAINETNHFVTVNVFDEYINERLTDLRSVSPIPPPSLSLPPSLSSLSLSLSLSPSVPPSLSPSLSLTHTHTQRHHDNGVSEPVRFPERERRFLGCVRIPLSAVYQVQVLEGVFKLEAPPVVLGYRQVSSALKVHYRVAGVAIANP
jgi:hypothetical protein